MVEVLSRLVSERGAPAFLRSNNGQEFVSRTLLRWITAQGISAALIDPGQPWQNGIGESFNRKFREECLSVEWFRSRADAKVVIETWRQHFNEARSHSSLGYQTPGLGHAMMQRSTGGLDTTGFDERCHRLDVLLRVRQLKACAVGLERCGPVSVAK